MEPSENRIIFVSYWYNGAMRMFFKTAGFLVTALLFATAALAMDEGDAAEQARRAHEKASTDMIYQQEEWKALYYQNIQIIQLLKDIRDLIQIQNEHSARDSQKS